MSFFRTTWKRTTMATCCSWRSAISETPSGERLKIDMQLHWSGASIGIGERPG